MVRRSYRFCKGSKMFSGSYVALVTPFKGGALDETALVRLIEWHLAEGTEGLVVCGSTGEGFSLTKTEHRQVVERAVAAVAGRIPLIAGASAMTTAGAVDLAQQAEAAGADGLLSVTPPYLKPTQEGLYAHFKTLNEATSLPILLYHHPGRTGTVMEEATLLKLARLPHIVGLKDSTDDLSCPLALRHAIGPDFVQVSGDDSTVLAFLAQGGQGGISTIGNVVPGLCATLHRLWREARFAEALTLQTRLYPLYKLAFSEASPTPVKYGLSYLGFCDDEVRPPLHPFSDTGRKALREMLESLKQEQQKDPPHTTVPEIPGPKTVSPYNA